MDCPECKNEMEFIESVHSNYNSGRAFKGQHTGNVYKCKACDEIYLDDFLCSDLYIWNYDL
jgi:hypothetical protein